MQPGEKPSSTPRNITIIDRGHEFNDPGGNLVILGGPASGKTLACKKVLRKALSNDIHALVVDWHGEYADIQSCGNIKIIGTGNYDNATPVWLTDQLVQITESPLPDLVIVETDACLDDSVIRQLIPLAQKSNRLIITSQRVQPFMGKSGMELLSHMGAVVFLRMTGQYVQEAGELFQLTEQQKQQMSGHNVRLSCL